MFFRRDGEERPDRAEATDQAEDKALEEMRARLQEARLPPQARKVVDKELERLAVTDPQIVEYTIGLNYLDFVAALPWGASTEDNADLRRASQILDARHCGLGSVKERILEHLAAKTLRGRRRRRVLVVDDESIARDNLKHVFSKDGYEVDGAGGGDEALRQLEANRYDAVVTDLKMEQIDGMRLLEEVRNRWPDVSVVLITGYATVDSAVEALKKGADHYLTKPVKLEELRLTVAAAMERRRNLATGRGPVLCFTGPPGTGKTSIGRAVAEALGRTFIRFSLAGLRDEAELRGHRRTYVGAMPGRILTEIKRAEYNNPVFMLDEIDKIGQDFRGDPAAVLMEVLDPEQNAVFRDHYLDMPFDLSRCMFIATANGVDNLPGPLLDRMEIITFPSYTTKEKRRIAKRFLVPKQLMENGLEPADASLTDAALDMVILYYTREAGLRNLEREIGSIARKLAKKRLLQQDAAIERYRIDAEDIPGLLGHRRLVREGTEAEPRVGVTTGLVWSDYGGEIIFVETAIMPGSGRLILTGSLGDVLRESAQTALSYIRSKSDRLGVPQDFFAASDIHIHIPAGAVPKDGPSAGVTIAMALVSLLTGRPARSDTAMSGELSLSGRILPVSGIREKMLAARQADVKRVVFPRGNEGEIGTLAPDVTEGLAVVLAAKLEEMPDQVLVVKT